MGAWLEIVHQPHRLELAGQPLPAFTPFEVPKGRVTFIGGFGQPVGIDVGEGTVSLPGPRAVFAAGSFFELGSIGLRLLGAPTDTSAWPLDVPRPPSVDEEALRVVSDVLLERGYSLGHRLLARSGDDQSWLGPFPAGAVARWRLGLVEALRLSRLPSRWASALSLCRLGAFCVLQSVTFDVEWLFDVQTFLEGLIAQGGMPFLEHIDVASPVVRAQAERLKKLVFDARPRAFPRLESLVFGRLI